MKVLMIYSLVDNSDFVGNLLDFSEVFQNFCCIHTLWPICPVKHPLFMVFYTIFLSTLVS